MPTQGRGVASTQNKNRTYWEQPLLPSCFCRRRRRTPEVSGQSQVTGVLCPFCQAGSKFPNVSDGANAAEQHRQSWRRDYSFNIRKRYVPSCVVKRCTNHLVGAYQIDVARSSDRIERDTGSNLSAGPTLKTTSVVGPARHVRTYIRTGLRRLYCVTVSVEMALRVDVHCVVDQLAC